MLYDLHALVEFVQAPLIVAPFACESYFLGNSDCSKLNRFQRAADSARVISQILAK